MKKFACFLNSKKLYILIVMTLLLYKFGLRIRALAKIKFSDLLDNGIIIFREKNSKIIKSQLLKETFDILTLLINECDLTKDNYIFYFFIFENDEYKRSLFLTQKYRILLHESRAFSLSSTKSLCSHIFGATHAVNIFKGEQMDFLRKELGHRFLSTTINNYIRHEDRQLNFFEEKNLGNFNSIKYLNKKRNITNLRKGKIKENDKHNQNNLETKVDLEDKRITLNKDDEEDMIDDDFEINKSTFYLTGHFYDDSDFLSYKNEKMKSLLKKKIKNKIIEENELKMI